MNIQILRNKYKEILELDRSGGKRGKSIHRHDKERDNDSSSGSSNQFQQESKHIRWVDSVVGDSSFSNKNYNRIKSQKGSPLQEISENIYRSSQSPQKKASRTPPQNSKQWVNSEQAHEKQMLKIKEKLAQCICNANKKDQLIKELEGVILKRDKEIELSLNSSQILKAEVSKHENNFIQCRVKCQMLSEQNLKYGEKLQSINIDCELMGEQIERYKEQVYELDRQLAQKDRNYDSLIKEFAKIDKVKSENERYKDDIKRLYFLISNNPTYEQMASKLEGKHFLGRPNKYTKELEYWYPACLIEGVESFLKKEQIGNGNKVFVENLTRFINGLTSKGETLTEKKERKRFNAKLKTMGRKRNEICGNISKEMCTSETMLHKPIFSQKSVPTQHTPNLKKTEITSKSRERIREHSLFLDRGSSKKQKSLRRSAIVGYNSLERSTKWKTMQDF